MRRPTTSFKGDSMDRRPTTSRRARLPVAALTAFAAALTIAASASAADAPWGFEQVTPQSKGGGSVLVQDTFTVGPGGNTFLYTTNAPFAGVATEGAPLYTRYMGTRGDRGWSNRALDVPFVAGLSQYNIQEVLGASEDLTHVFITSPAAATPGAIAGGSNLYVRDTRTGALTLVLALADPGLSEALGNPQGFLSFKFLADDGRSALFSAGVPLTPGASRDAVYRWTVDGGVEAVSVLPASEGGAIVPYATAGRDAEYGVRDSVSYDDALTNVYFSENGGSGAVYVRSGDTTRAISVSRIPGDPATPVQAWIDAITDKGRYLLFHTNNVPLTADTPVRIGAGYVYRYDIVSDTLTFVAALDASNLTNGRGVLQMTQDAQTVLFQSTYAQAAGAVEDGMNMYVWRHGTIRHVATSDTGFPPSTATAAGSFLRLLSPSGRFASFTDSSASLAQRFGYDNTSAACPVPYLGGPGPCAEVYLFDAEAAGGTGELTCVSCKRDGTRPIGQSGDPAFSMNPTTVAVGFVRLNSHQAQTVADDGTVFFTTPDALVPADANGKADVYASKDGTPRLISRGAQGATSRFLDATPDGKTVFFSTDDPIVPTDTDRSADIYMTRAGAGYAYDPPPTAPPCSGGDCRETVAPSGPETIAASVVFSGPGNGSGPSNPSAKVTVAKVPTVIGTTASLRVTVPAQGRLVAAGSGLRTTAKAASRPATYTVRVALTAKAAAGLRTTRSARNEVRLTFTPTGGSPSKVTVPVTFKAAAATRKGR